MKQYTKNNHINEDVCIDPEMNLGIDTPFDDVLEEFEYDDLYESIIKSVSKTVKQCITEGWYDNVDRSRNTPATHDKLLIKGKFHARFPERQYTVTGPFSVNYKKTFPEYKNIDFIVTNKATKEKRGFKVIERKSKSTVNFRISLGTNFDKNGVLEDSLVTEFLFFDSQSESRRIYVYGVVKDNIIKNVDNGTFKVNKVRSGEGILVPLEWLRTNSDWVFTLKNYNSITESLDENNDINEYFSDDNISNIHVDSFMDECDVYSGKKFNNYYYFGDCKNTVDKDHTWNATLMAGVIQQSSLYDINMVLSKLNDGDRTLPSRLVKKLDTLVKSNMINDMSEVVCAINEYLRIMTIYLTDTDTHYFFDCE